MKNTSSRVLTIVVLTMTLACEAKPEPIEEPPAGSYTAGTYQVKIDTNSTSAPGAQVTTDFFSLVRIPILIGRAFVVADSAHKVVILSYEFWKERFASAPDAIGRTIEVDGVPTTIVGITGEGNTFPEGARLWLPK
jgi:hypothetical protein